MPFERGYCTFNLDSECILNLGCKLRFRNGWPLGGGGGRGVAGFIYEACGKF